MGNGNMKPMGMGNRNEESEHGTGTRNGPPGMENQEWGTGNGYWEWKTGNKYRERGIGIGTGNEDREWEHEIHRNGEQEWGIGMENKNRE